jgi:hypothetical protein
MLRTRMKIAEGVARGLCGNCVAASIRMFDSGEQQVICSSFTNGRRTDRNVPRVVVECSEHSPKGQQSKQEMQQIAWIIEVKRGQVAGFLDPKAAKEAGLLKEWWDE